MDKIKRIASKLYSFHTKSHLITLLNLQSQMEYKGFPLSLTNEVLLIFENTIKTNGLERFQKELSHLNYNLPKTLQNDNLLRKFYEHNTFWFDEELLKLEQETKLSWEEQSEDLNEKNISIRKAELVLRDRLQWIIFDIKDDRLE